MAASNRNPSEEEEDSARRAAVDLQLSYEQYFVSSFAAVQTVAAITRCAASDESKEAQPPSTEIFTVASIVMTVTVCAEGARVRIAVGARVGGAVGAVCIYFMADGVQSVCEDLLTA